MKPATRQGRGSDESVGGSVRDDRAVFIAGMAHSGKTPLRRMLGLHPNLSLTRSTYLWTRFLDRFGPLAEPANLDRCLDELADDPDVAALSPRFDLVRTEFAAGPSDYMRLFAIIHGQHARSAAKPRWGDQLGGIEHLGPQLLRYFPHAVIIHVMRDPRQVALMASVRGNRHGSRPGAIASRWNASAASAAEGAARSDGRHHMVTFEDVCRRPTEVLRTLLRVIGEQPAGGIASDAAISPLTEFVEREASDIAASGLSLDDRRAIRITAMCGPAMERLGYATTSAALAPSRMAAYRLIDRPRDHAAAWMWRRRNTSRSETQ